MKRVLIVGASGFVGSNLAVFLRRHYRVIGTHATQPVRVDNVLSFSFPLRSGADYRGLLRLSRPDVIVYCAAERDEERCHQFPHESFYVNAIAPGEFALAAQTLPQPPRMIFLSTSKVFSGDRGGYVETDAPDGHSQYGISKLRGEESLSSRDNTFILRLGTLFGLSAWNQDSMLNRILLKIWREEMTPLIQDEFRSFLSVEDLCQVIERIVGSDNIHSGLYHVGTPEKESYFQFGQRLAHAFGLSDRCLLPISGKSFTGHGFNPENRGHDLSLKGDLFHKDYHFHPRDTDFSLRLIHHRLSRGSQ